MAKLEINFVRYILLELRRHDNLEKIIQLELYFLLKITENKSFSYLREVEKVHINSPVQLTGLTYVVLLLLA